MNSLAIFQVLYVPVGKEIHIYERESWNKTQSLSAETEVHTVDTIFILISAHIPVSAQLALTAQLAYGYFTCEYYINHIKI